MIAMKIFSGKNDDRFCDQNRLAFFMKKSGIGFCFQIGSRLKSGFPNEISDGR